MKKVIISVFLVVVIVALLAASCMLIFNACKANNEEVKNPVLNLEIENYGDVKIELYPEYAPNTVKNIVALAQNGFYNGKIFYGVDDVAIYVGRDSEGNVVNPKVSDVDKSVAEDSTANNYEYSIDGEFVANNFKSNTLKHQKGIVSLVRTDYSKQLRNLESESYNSGNSQFTIIVNDENAANLNGMYAAFGKVIEGLDIVERIFGLDVKKAETDSEENASTSEESIKQFESAPVIKNATVETYGEDYGVPTIHEAFDYNSYLQDLMTQYSNQ